MPRLSLQERVSRAYKTPGHPVAFSAPGTVARHFNITQDKAKEILEHIEGYTLHREYKKPKIYNPYYVHKRREQVQADLIDISKIARQNNGVQHLLLLIDIFTKRVWVYPVKNKNARTIESVLSRWIRSLDETPDKLMTDQGTEFVNQRVQNLLLRHNIEWQAALGTSKAAIAERANKSIQILIYKYLTQNETLRYIDKLDNIIQSYNKRGHRSLDFFSPQQADSPQNEGMIHAIHQTRYTKLAAHRRDTLPFKVGDLVRIKTDVKQVSSSRRAYAEQFKGEYFNIIRINRTLPIAMYYLRSVDTQELIRGGFYANELQRQRGDIYKIERIIRRRVRNGVREIFVKWKYFSPQWNEWIPEENIVNIF